MHKHLLSKVGWLEVADEVEQSDLVVDDSDCLGSVSIYTETKRGQNEIAHGSSKAG